MFTPNPTSQVLVGAGLALLGLSSALAQSGPGSAS